MKRLLLALVAVVCFCGAASAQYVKVLGVAEKSGSATVSGVSSTNKPSITFPGATITIYSPSGTTTIASIFTNSTGTVKANPYTASLTDATYDFFIASGASFDVRVSGSSGGVAISAFTRPGYVAVGSSGQTLVNCSGVNDTVLLATANTNGGTIVIPKSITCASNSQTLSIALQIDNGGLLKPITGQTVTLSGPQNPDIWQKFTNATTGLGTIAFTGNTSIDRYYIDWWGTPAGTADSAICQAAATAFPIGAYVKLVPNRTYATRFLTIKQGQTWDLTGATMIALTSSVPGVNNELFDIGATTGIDLNGTIWTTNTALSSATQGATSITVTSSSGFAAGDRVVISAGSFTGSGAEFGPIEFNLVASIPDATHITVTTPLAYNYSGFGLPSAANKKVYKVPATHARNIRILGGTLQPDAAFNSIYFNISGTEDVEIDHVTFNGIGNGLTTGGYNSRLNFHDNVLQGAAIAASGTAINFASLVYSRIVNNTFNSYSEIASAAAQFNHLLPEVTCHDNLIQGNTFGPIRASGSGAVEFDIYAFNNRIIGNRVWGVSGDVTAGTATLGIRTYAVGVVAGTGNVISGNIITDILTPIGDASTGSIITGNILINSTSHVNARGMLLVTLTGNIAQNTISGFPGSFVTSGGGVPTVQSLIGIAFGEFWGNGSPETVVTAGIGSIFHRLDGGAATSVYVKESGTGNTGWIAK